MKLKILILLIISGLTFGQTYIKPEIDTLNMKVPSTVPTEVGQVGMFINGAMSLEKVYTQSQVDEIQNNLENSIVDNAADNNQDALIQRLYEIVDSLGTLIEAGINPFPSAPYNLIAYDTLVNQINITYDYTGSAPDSFAIWVDNTSTDPPANPSYYTTNDSLEITGLASSTNYNIWVKAIIDSFYSGTSNIINITTLADNPYSFTPDLAGVLSGTTLGDFSLRSAEGSGTFTIDNSTYKLYFDSTSTFHESTYGQKTFTAQSDSVFIETMVNIPSSITMFNASDEHIIFTLADTVAGTFMASFGIEDGDANRSADRWYLRYRNNGSYSESTSTTAFNLITDKRIQIAWRDLGDGSSTIQAYVNDTLVINLSSLTVSADAPNALICGNTDLSNVNDYAVYSTWYYDNAYADSRYFGNSGTGGTPVSTDLGDYYVDYVDGLETNDGLSTTFPLKYSPDDALSTSGITLASGDTVVFKGGVSYLGQLTAVSGVTYRSDYHWGTGKAVFDMQGSREYAIKGNADNVNIERIAFYNWATSGSNYTVYPATGSTDWDIDSCVFGLVKDWDNVSLFPDKAAIVFTNSTSGHSVTNSEFFATGRNGITIRYASDISIRNNNFGGINRGDSTGYMSVGVRMEVTARDIEIVGNTFHDFWQYGGDVVPELNHSPACVRTGSMTTGGDISIDSNFFYTNRQMLTGTGTGNIEIAGGDNIRVRGNTAVNTVQYFGTNILITLSDSVLIENNTFIDRDYTTGY